ncbi:MAG: hypothetical protein QNJ12_18435 [Ilumatobacter sp.]|uniref:hypothetical protein n=1 Tax=Ilumatobacter sp. TaxID=1967498 RepID=UPI0026064DEA|nr:hypothetical protein [Ilumatobacter sp.]MDJ0770778.1 hypothetical protein [Ilumatobacter sp.]
MKQPAIRLGSIAASVALAASACSSDSAAHPDGGIVVTSGSTVSVIAPDGTLVAERDFGGEVDVTRVSHAAGTMLVHVDDPAETVGRAVVVDAWLEGPVDLGSYDSPSSWFQWRGLASPTTGWSFRVDGDFLLFDAADGSVHSSPSPSAGQLGQQTVDGSWLIGNPFAVPPLVERFDAATGQVSELDVEWYTSEWASAVTGLDASRLGSLVDAGDRFGLTVQRPEGGFSIEIRSDAGGEIVTVDDDGEEVARVPIGRVRHLGVRAAIFELDDGAYAFVEPTTGDRLFTYQGGFFQLAAPLGDRLFVLDSQVLIDIDLGLQHEFETVLPVDVSPGADQLVLHDVGGADRVLIGPCRCSPAGHARRRRQARGVAGPRRGRSLTAQSGGSSTWPCRRVVTRVTRSPLAPLPPGSLQCQLDSGKRAAVLNHRETR